MKPEQIINTIKEVLKENLTPEETLEEINQYLPVKTVFIQEPPKSSPEKLEYLKRYRENKKELEKLKQKINSKQLIKETKIQKALLRQDFVCYQCKKHVRPDISRNTYSEVLLRGQKRKKLIISNFCPFCSNKLNGFGGYLDLS